MENLDAALSAKKLEDLETKVVSSDSNLIEPTVEEIELIIAALVDGKSYSEIKKTIRRVEMEKDVQISAKGFSYGQIKEIDLARLASLEKLT